MSSVQKSTSQNGQEQPSTQSQTAVDFSYSSSLKGLFGTHNEQEQTTTVKVPTKPASKDDEQQNGGSVMRRMELMQKLQDSATGATGVRESACVFQKLAVDSSAIEQVRAIKGDFVLEDDGLEPMMIGEAGAKRKRRGGGSNQPFQIMIPLASSERAKIQDLKKVLRSEYGARYCEAIGVSPTQQNISNVLKQLPLEQCRVSQMFHPGLGRGERRNNIVIQPAHHAGPANRQQKASPVPLEVLGDPSLDDKGPSAARKKRKEPTGPASAVPSFDDYKSRYVYPFNLASRFEPQVRPDEEEKNGGARVSSSKFTEKGGVSAAKKLLVHDTLVAKLRPSPTSDAVVDGEGTKISHEQIRTLERMLADEDEEEAGRAQEDESAGLPEGHSGKLRSGEKSPSTRGSSAGVSKAEDGGKRYSGKEALDAAINRELEQEYVDFEEPEIAAMQQQFLADFPFSRYAARMPSSMLDSVKVSLTHRDVAVAVQSMLQFLFVAYIAPLSGVHGSKATPAEKDALFVAMYRQVSRLVQAKSRHATNSSLEMPLVLLSVRVLVEAEMKSKYPTFFRCALGVRTMASMDRLVVAVLDPLGFHSHISMLESAPQVMHVMRTKRLPPRYTNLATTPLTQFILGDQASSTEAKKLARSQPATEAGLSELKKHLTPMVRSQLLRIVSEEKLEMYKK